MTPSVHGNPLLFDLESVPKSRDGNAATAQVLRRKLESNNVRVVLEKICNRVAQSTGTRSVDDAHFGKLREERLVEKFVRPTGRVIDRTAEKIDLARNRL